MKYLIVQSKRVQSLLLLPERLPIKPNEKYLEKSKWHLNQIV